MALSYRGYGKTNSSTIILKWYKNPEHPSHPHYFILFFMWGRNKSNQIHCQFIIDKKKRRQNCQPFRYQKDSKDWQPLKDKRSMFYWQTNTYLGEALTRFQNRANCPLGNVFFCFQVYLNYIAKHVQTVFNIWQIILQGQQWITKPNPLMNSIRKPMHIKQIFLRLQTKRNKAKHNLFSS